ncbi:MAG: threonine synthase, partial [Clostridiales bacterium]|nr:threonine synthase [Clostridiales bacterium]
QIVYYISAYCDLLKQGAISCGDEINICVPTGNFGNILAAYYAKRMGLPVKKLICASNSNNVLTDFIRTGVYDRNRPFYTTVSPSMDILISSNLERLLYLLSGEDDKLTADYMAQLSATGRYEVSPAIRVQIQNLFAAGFSTEAQTEAMIGAMKREQDYLIDTHTAVAFEVLRQYREETGDNTITVVASTASPFKFCDAVLDALGVTEKRTGTDLLDQLAQVSGVAAPAPLATLKDKQVRFDGWTEKEAMEQVVTDFLR